MNELIYYLFATGSAATGTYLLMKGINKVVSGEESQEKETKGIKNFLKRNLGKIYLITGTGLLAAPMASGFFYPHKEIDMVTEAAINYLVKPPTNSTRLDPVIEKYLENKVNNYIIESLKGPLSYFSGILAGVGARIGEKVLKREV
jgi:hypothetical protein